MRVEQLHYLMEIISCGSLTSAAKKLHTTQQALSVFVKALEDECGVSLFTRSKSGLALTKDGEALLPHFQNLVNEYQTILAYQQSLVQNAYEELPGEIHFACSVTIARTLAPKLTEIFRNTFPHVNLVIHDFENSLASKLMSESSYDLVLFNIDKGDLSAYTPPDTYTSAPIILDSLVAICSKDSSLAKRRSVTSAKLCQYDLVLFHTNPYHEMWGYERTFSRKNISPKSVTQCNIESSFFKMIQGDTISLYGKIAFKNIPFKDHYDLTAIKIKDSSDFFYVLNTLKANAEQIYVQYFAQILQDLLLSLV